MGKIIRADRTQHYMFPPMLDDYISRDHLARFIVMVVDKMDLVKMGFQLLSVGPGRPYYDEKMMVCLFLYAYYKKITAFRGIEELTRNDIGAIWITGMNYPDHNSFWRFYHRNTEGLKKLFKHTVKMSMNMGLTGLVLQAVDGTKITADVSKQKALYKKDLQTILKMVEDSIESYFKTLGASHDENKTKPSVKLPRSIKGMPLEDAITAALSKMKTDEEKIALKEAVEDKLKDLEDAQTASLSPTDPDARMMKNHEGTRFGYNAQIVVDEQNGIIVAQDVTNHADDHKELVGMVEESLENTKADTDRVVTVADGGYAASQALADAEEKGLNVLVNPNRNELKNRKSPFHQQNFRYDEENDCYYCTYGGRLEFSSIVKKSPTNIKDRRYKCKDYKNCPYRDKCSKEKGGRTIQVKALKYRQAIENNLKRLQEPDNDALLRKRGQIVERKFGQIKRIQRFRRWTFRGLDNVKTQWALICSIQNLRKMYKVWVKDVRNDHKSMSFGW